MQISCSYLRPVGNVITDFPLENKWLVLSRGIKENGGGWLRRALDAQSPTQPGIIFKEELIQT
jgi:hypothetical protein